MDRWLPDAYYEKPREWVIGLISAMETKNGHRPKRLAMPQEEWERLILARMDKDTIHVDGGNKTEIIVEGVAITWFRNEAL